MLLCDDQLQSFMHLTHNKKPMHASLRLLRRTTRQQNICYGAFKYLSTSYMYAYTYKRSHVPLPSVVL